MCGIAGILSKHPTSTEVIHSMTMALKHRGPDAQATYISNDGSLAFGHVRLSIIDLSSAANQPMHSHDGDLTIVFNGEIYNFEDVGKELRVVQPGISFTTQSDTETILLAFKQWGPDMVTKLNGMFAMAIYDHQSQTLYFFRDRLGKKPLYYYEDDEHFVFASEIKGLLKHPLVLGNKNVNMRAIHSFLHLGYIPEPQTIFTSIKKFPAGHVGVKKLTSELKTQSYWSIEKVFDLSGAHTLSNITDIKSELKSALSESVQKRLISDVPVGTFLSGGTDSSIVTAIAAQHHRSKLKTFSIGFKESKYDESRYAEQVAKRLSTDHHAYTLGEDDAMDILETYLHHFDEPFVDTSAIPTLLVSQLTRKEVTVALTGDGGDELFQGYGSYNWATRLSNPILQAIQTPISTVVRRMGNDRFKRIGEMLEKVDVAKRPSHIFSQEQYLFSDSEIRSLLQNPKEYSPFLYSQVSPDITMAEQQAIFDLNFYLKDDLLVKVDRASMYHALECRCPLLDHHVVELALRIPMEYKVRSGERKWILKELLKEYLPDELIYRPKWGFSVPLPNWLNGKLGYLIDDYLNESNIRQFGIVKFEAVKQLLDRFKSGEHHVYNRLWVLIVMHKWLKENG